MGPNKFFYLEDEVLAQGQIVGVSMTPTGKKYYLKFFDYSAWMTESEINDADWISEVNIDETQLIQMIDGGLR